MTKKYHPIPFKEAADYVLKFGKYTGKTLDAVASSDVGLVYLDWARGTLRLAFHTKNAICSYLDDPTIAKDLAKLVGDMGDK